MAQQNFFTFLRKERTAFSNRAAEFFPAGGVYTAQRVVCENILIAYDQAVENLLLADRIISMAMPYLEEMQADNFSDESVGIRYDQELEDALKASKAFIKHLHPEIDDAP